jgi:ribosomal protein L6P/L9E
MLNEKFFEFNFYNEEKKIKIMLFKKTTLRYHDNSNSIEIKYTHPIILTKALHNLKKVIFSYNHRFFIKIKYKGKGFKMKIRKKKLKMIKYWFGHSHLNVSFFKNIKLKKCGKYKFTIKSSSLKKLNSLEKKICQIKPLNKYTKRGIRAGRMFFEKRKGKKSSYV